MRTHRKLLYPVALAAAFGMRPAAAEDTPKPLDPAFEKLDRNHDGYLSREELRGYGKAFDEADENKDGRIDPSEFVKAQAIHDRMAAGKYVDDSVVTAKVKAALLKEPDPQLAGRQRGDQGRPGAALGLREGRRAAPEGGEGCELGGRRRVREGRDGRQVTPALPACWSA